MTDVEGTFEDFLASRRSGRRNAVHEIETAAGEQGATDLSQSLGQLNVNKSDADEDTESNRDSPAKEEENQGGGNQADMN